MYDDENEILNGSGCGDVYDDVMVMTNDGENEILNEDVNGYGLVKVIANDDVNEILNESENENEVVIVNVIVNVNGGTEILNYAF